MFLVQFVVVLSVLFAGLIIWWYSIFFKYKKYMKKFLVPNQWPLFGVILQIQNVEDIHERISTAIKDIGKNIFCMIGPIPALITTDPKLYSLVLGSTTHINKPYIFTKMLEPLLGEAVLTASDINWRHQRKFLNKFFDYNSIIQNVPNFNIYANDLVKTLNYETNKKNSKSVQIDNIIMKWSLELAMDSILGGNLDREDKLKHLDIGLSLLDILIRKLITIAYHFKITYVFTKLYWEERNILKLLHGHIKNVLRSIIKEQKYNANSIESPLINAFIKEMETDKQITEDFAVKQLLTLITAAADTSASTISHTLYSLSKNPQIQQKVYNEIFSILGDDISQPITHHHVKEMKYLNAIIKETLRLYTPIPYFARKLSKDVEFDGTTLPGGLTIVFFAYGMHKDPELYHDPEEFKPERFLENETITNFNYTPFSTGIRNCLGKKYAEHIIPIALAKLILNYEFSDAHHDLRLVMEIFLHSKNGVRVGIRRRNYEKHL